MNDITTKPIYKPAYRIALTTGKEIVIWQTVHGWSWTSPIGGRGSHESSEKNAILMAFSDARARLDDFGGIEKILAAVPPGPAGDPTNEAL